MYLVKRVKSSFTFLIIPSFTPDLTCSAVFSRSFAFFGSVDQFIEKYMVTK
jgi:hypothetical protein